MATTAIIPIRTPYDQGGLFSYPWLKWFQSVQATLDSSTRFALGTHAQRLANAASKYVDGSLYVETDRRIAYIAIGSVWIYFTGILMVTQEALPTDLSDNDFGLLCCVTDYRHLLRWDGSAWDWAPGELGSDFAVSFHAAPGDGWHACDGSQVNRLNSDGTVTVVTLPASTLYYRV